MKLLKQFENNFQNYKEAKLIFFAGIEGPKPEEQNEAIHENNDEISTKKEFAELLQGINNTIDKVTNDSIVRMPALTITANQDDMQNSFKNNSKAKEVVQSLFDGIDLTGDKSTTSNLPDMSIDSLLTDTPDVSLADNIHSNIDNNAPERRMGTMPSAQSIDMQAPTVKENVVLAQKTPVDLSKENQNDNPDAYASTGAR